MIKIWYTVEKQPEETAMIKKFSAKNFDTDFNLLFYIWLLKNFKEMISDSFPR